jgi:hypothetical protein
MDALGGPFHGFYEALLFFMQGTDDSESHSGCSLSVVGVTLAHTVPPKYTRCLIKQNRYIKTGDSSKRPSGCG